MLRPLQEVDATCFFRQDFGVFKSLSWVISPFSYLAYAYLRSMCLEGILLKDVDAKVSLLRFD